jgi:HSP20 family molecular chaperone IbpA
MALSTFTGPFGGFGDPFFDQLERSVDRAFNRSLMGPGLGRPSVFTDLMAVPTFGTTLGAAAPTSADWWRSMGGTHPMDVVETDKEYEITADAPGFLPEDISVEVHDGNISIRGQRQEAKEDRDESGRVWRSERAFRTFHRCAAGEGQVHVGAVCLPACLAGCLAAWLHGV